MELLPALINIMQTSRYLAGYFYTDSSGLFQTFANESAPAETATSTLQGVMTAGTKSQWLVLVRPQGVVEVRTDPSCRPRRRNLTFRFIALDTAQTDTRVLHDAFGHT